MNTSVRLSLSLLPEQLKIVQLPASAPVPSGVFSATFFSVTRTADELSIVCPQSVDFSGGATLDDGWRCFKVEGKLEFSLTGILASLADPLAKAGISIFAVSTYDTDYICVKADRIDAARIVLGAAGHHIVT